MKRDGNNALVVRFLATLPVLGLDVVSTRVFGEFKVRLANHGQIVVNADLFIDSVALSRGATSVTGNRRHYDRLPGLIVENWLRA